MCSLHKSFLFTKGFIIKSYSICVDLFEMHLVLSNALPELSLTFLGEQYESLSVRILADVHSRLLTCMFGEPPRSNIRQLLGISKSPPMCM